MAKIYYKVLTKDRYSAFVANKRVRVKYPIDKWVEAKIPGSRLMVFDDITKAINWKNSVFGPCSGHIVVSCNCIGIISPNYTFNRQVYMDSQLPLTYFKIFWTCWNKLRKACYQFDRYN